MSMPDQEKNQQPLAIIGNEEVVAGFRALGFRVYPAAGLQETRKALQEALRQRPGVCLIEADTYALVKQDLAVYEAAAMPVFVPFSKDAGVPALQGLLKEIRLRATGKLTKD